MVGEPILRGRAEGELSANRSPKRRVSAYFGGNDGGKIP
jgi:hypothetical protein